MAEYDFHFTAAVMDGIFGEVIEARGAWDTLDERLDNMEQGTGDTYTKAEVDTMLAEKVDKVTGKGLSTNDFTDSEKAQISANTAGIGAVTNNGAKNFLKNTAVSQTISGVTFTINSDKSVTLSGTAVANITSFFISREVPALTGNMVLSGCPEGGSTNTYRLDILDGTPNGTVLFEDFGEGADVDWSLITTGIYTTRIRIGSGTTVDGLTFKPMLCPKALYDIDNTYVPYAPTNRELYEMILALQNA